MQFIPTDWQTLFAVETPVLELVARGVLLYVGILVLMRILPRRIGGEVAHMDLIFMLLIADAAGQSLGDYQSVSEGMIVIGTLMALVYGINMLSFHLPFLEHFPSHPPLEIARDGKLLRANMQREFLTEEELMSYLRQSGYDDLGKVKLAMVEGKGKVSIVPLSE